MLHCTSPSTARAMAERCRAGNFEGALRDIMSATEIARLCDEDGGQAGVAAGADVSVSA